MLFLVVLWLYTSAFASFYDQDFADGIALLCPEKFLKLLLERRVHGDRRVDVQKRNHQSSIAKHNIWNAFTDDMKLGILGESFAGLSFQELNQQGIWTSIIQASREKMLKTCDVCDAASQFEPFAQQFFEGKVMKRWCKTFEDLCAVPGKCLPSFMIKEQAYLKILLFLDLSAIETNIRCVFLRDDPKLMGHLQDKYFWTAGCKYAILLASSPIFAMMDFLVSVVERKNFILLATDLEGEKLRSVHGGIYEGLLRVFEHDEQHIANVRRTREAFNAVQEGLFERFAQYFLDTIEKSDFVEGLRRLIMGFQLMHESRMFLALLGHNVTLERPFEDLLIEYISNKRPVFTDTGMGDIVWHVFARDVQYEDKAIALMIAYTKEFFLNNPVDMQKKQKHIISTLEQGWGMSNINGDFEGYQRLVLGVVAKIFTLDQAYYAQSSYAKDVVDVFSYKGGNRSMFFTITDTLVDYTDFYHVPGPIRGDVPLPECVEKMNQQEREILLSELLKIKMTYVQLVEKHRDDFPICMRLLPFEKGYAEEVKRNVRCWFSVRYNAGVFIGKEVSVLRRTVNSGYASR